jgi:enamine deaminase RidA (YjgF/YER057c/UK114 family)
MTPVELVRSTALTDTVPYAYATVTPPGRLVFTAGACPLDHDGAVVSPGDVAGQAQQVMANLAVALGAAGAELTDVAKTTVYVASSSRTDLVTAWQVVRNAFGDHDAPSTLLGVAALGHAGQLVEVEAVAVTGGGLAGRVDEPAAALPESHRGPELPN